MIRIFRKFLNNAYGMTIIKKGIVILAGLISMVLLTRYLGPELKGEYSYFFNIATIGTTVLNLGISLVYPEYKRKEYDYRNLFISVSIIQFVLYMIVSMLFLFYSSTLNYGLVALLISISILNLQLSQLNLVEDIRSHSLVIVVGAVSNCIFTLSIFFFFNSSVSLALLVFMLKNIIMIVLTLQVLKKGFRFEASKIFVKNILIAGFLPMLTTLLVSINYRIDIVLLGVLNVSYYDIGLYSVGVQLAEYSWMIPDIFKEVMLHKNARKDNVQEILFSLRMANTAVAIFILIMALGGKYVIGILFGSSFIGAYFITVVMFLAVPSMVYAKIIATLFIANGRWRFYFTTLCIAVVLNVVLNFILVPFMGILGSSLASVISYGFSGAVFFIWFLRNTEARWNEMILVRKCDIERGLLLLRR
ncbi:polysaccharide biosynthesis C-terminal domain-containing protein [Listeria booriae]|uniref:Oligosaccharide flippase family protein n=1 Tax=Listeria booriae TaxID=1552123 RepID=A0A841ZTB0_9LIST|nr:polysaccharide biosynthesis C-terminal domain-containing protein [Listeria booriae]MBC1565088.1 oligosaccharide flippase family protein [Listeria booriae]